MGDLEQPLIQQCLVFHAIVLYLNEVTLMIKNPLIFFCGLKGSFISPLPAWAATSPFKQPLKAISPRDIGTAGLYRP
jgi:hypothetical protein